MLSNNTLCSKRLPIGAMAPAKEKPATSVGSSNKRILSLPRSGMPHASLRATGRPCISSCGRLPISFSTDTVRPLVLVAYGRLNARPQALIRRCLDARRSGPWRAKYAGLWAATRSGALFPGSQPFPFKAERHSHEIVLCKVGRPGILPLPLPLPLLLFFRIAAHVLRPACGGQRRAQLFC